MFAFLKNRFLLVILFSTIINSFFNNSNVYTCFENLSDVRDRIIDLIPVACSVGIGNSQTLKKINVSKLLRERGNIVFNTCNLI